MALTPGARLGVYEITAPIGEGGMGQVFRARDTRLDRDVAIKVLPDLFAQDADRLARFRREAKTLAALNHPHIAGIHGLEECDGITALVMELVEGEDLAQRLSRGAIPIDEAVSIATQIAAALEAAHDQGIIHRDLKPANIKLTPAGIVKVLDFGLAKAVDGGGAPGALSMSPTLSVHATQAGVILGSAPYMSPEQARGKAVDRRTDIWAFGCVLYEMLAGKRVIDSDETVSDTIAAILRAEVDWSRLPADTPSHVRALLRRCLQKDLQKRLPHIGVARLDLDEGSSAPATATVPATRAPQPLAWAVAAAFAVIAAWALWQAGFETPAVHPGLPIRALVSLPDQVLPMQFEISPDGGRVAYLQRFDKGRRVSVFELATSSVTPIQDSSSAQSPFWSPDGQSVGFFVGSSLKTVSIAGGASRLISDGVARSGGASGAAWAPDGTIIFASRDGILAVGPQGGTPVRLTSVDSSRGELGHFSPQILPDGRRFLFGVGTAGRVAQTIALGSLDGAQPRAVVTADAGAYVNGRLLFVRGGRLLVQSCDPNTLELKGEVGVVASRVTNRAGAFAVASNGGVVVFRETDPSDNIRLIEYDRSGRELRTFGEPGNYANPALSPDGQRLIIGASLPAQQTGPNVVLMNLDRNTVTRLTFGTGENDAVWSPDGKRIAFSSTRAGKSGLYVQDATPGGQPTLLLEGDTGGVLLYPDDWSPDGRSLLYTRGEPTGRDLWTISLADGKSTLWLQTPTTDDMAAFSPDGRWVAYVSERDVYIRSRDGSGGKWQVSTDGGMQPQWRGDGKELYFLSAGGAALYSVGLISTAPIELDTPRKMFDVRLPIITRRQWVVSKDGQRFIILTVREEDAVAPPLNLISNWPALPGVRRN